MLPLFVRTNSHPCPGSGLFNMRFTKQIGRMTSVKKAGWNEMFHPARIALYVWIINPVGVTNPPESYGCKSGSDA